MLLFEIFEVLHEARSLLFPPKQHNLLDVFIETGESLLQHGFLLKKLFLEFLLELIYLQRLLGQFGFQNFHLVFILFAEINDFISNSFTDSLHLLQIFSFISVIKQIRVPFDDYLFEEVFPKMFLNQIPDFLRVIF